MISAGILPSGFCWRIESLASVGSAFSMLTSFSKPRMPRASFTLRPNGDGGDERKIIMYRESQEMARCARDEGLILAKALRSAGDNEVHGLRTLALLVRLDIEVDALAFVERFHSGALHRRDVDEYVASAIVGLDEPVTTFTVEELDHSTLRHREAPFPNCSRPPRHGSSAGHSHEREKRRVLRVISAGPPREAERQSQHVRVDNNQHRLERGEPSHLFTFRA